MSSRWARRRNAENVPLSMVGEQQVPPITRGYFVFPPGRVVLRELPESNEADASESSQGGDERREHAWEELRQGNEEARCMRLKMEGEIASKGETDWVR